MTNRFKYQTPVEYIDISGLSSYRTNEWRYQKPQVTKEKCTKCGLCWLYCPSQSMIEYDTYFEADLEYCKGCGICAEECPTKAIEMITEVGAK